MAIMPGQARRWPKNPVVLLAAILPLVLSATLTGAILSARGGIHPIEEPPRFLLPGHALPTSARCSWPPYGGEMVLCHVLWKSNTLYLTYNTREQQIVRTSVPIDEQTVGSLVVIWGAPTGVRKYNWSIQLYWGVKSVYTSARPFYPGNRTTFVSYTLEEDDTLPWHGFTS